MIYKGEGLVIFLSLQGNILFIFLTMCGVNKFLYIFVFVLAIIVGAEDELSLGDAESDVKMIVFRCGRDYAAYMVEQKRWSGLQSLPSGFEMNDGEFVDITADIVRLYGGLAGHTGTPQATKIKESKSVPFEDMLKRDLIEKYDPARFRFWGLRVLKTKQGVYIAASNSSQTYRLYKDGNFVGSYKTTLELERAAGLNTLDSTVTMNSAGKLPFYVMRLGKTYYAYASHIGLNKWTPLLNKAFKNDPIYFSLEDGELAQLQTTALTVNGGKMKYDNAPMFVDSVEFFEKIRYDALSLYPRMEHWEQGPPQKEADFRQYQDNSGLYLIVYLEKKYWVYKEDYSENKKRLVGKFRKSADVDKALKRR